MHDLIFVFIFVIVLLTNIIGSFSQKNKITKFIYVCMTICIILLAKSQTWNYDYEAYRYYYKVSGGNILSGVEIGFEILSQLSSKIFSLSYENFRFLFFIIMFSVVAIYIWRLSDRPCFVQLLYFVCFFAVNITQIRSGMSEAFVIASIYYLKKKLPVKYILSMVLAISFHYSAIFFLLFSLLYFQKTERWLSEKKKTIAISSLILLVAFRVVGSLIPTVVRFINNIMGNDYRSTANFAEYAGNHYLKYLPIPVLTILLFYILRHAQHKIGKEIQLYEMMAYISLVIYPLFTVNRQLSRISRTVVILSFIPFTKYLLMHIKNKKLIFSIFFVVYIGYVYYSISAYTSCLDALLYHSALSCIFG